MKILFSSYSPFGTSGYSTQLNKIVNCLYSYDSTIEFGFICWDIPSHYLSKSQNPYTYTYLLDFFATHNIKINCFNEEINAKFYICGGKNNYWAKIDKFNKNFKCDKLIVFQDVHVFEPFKAHKIQCKKYLYVPIHTDCYNNAETKNLHHLGFFDKIATPSQFGVNVLKTFMYNCTLIDHIVDEIKIEDKECNFYDIYNLTNDMFICLINSRNSENNDRKAFAQQLEAFSLFLNGLSKIERDKCRLIIHDTNKLSLKGEIDLESIVKKLDISDKILCTKSILSNEEIIQLYNLSDVLLCASKSEGFGLPMVEAQIHGTPVITTNCTSMATNTFYGICTEPNKIASCVGEINSWSIPSPENISDAINYIYNLKYNKDNSNYNFQLGKIDKQRYSSKTIMNMWISFLELEKDKTENIFKNHLNEVKTILSKKPIRNIIKSEECKYNAILIENRKDIKIEPILLNLLHFTTDEIGIQIFYNQENEEFIKDIINKYNLQNISLNKLPYETFDIDDYQDFLFSEEFYDNINGEKILIFQTDSLLFKQFDMNYFKFDFIGAIWNEDTMKQPTLSKLFKNKIPIGNGGFNIRNNIKCRMIADKIYNFKRPSINVYEDNIYSYLLQENMETLDVSFPSIEEAKSFSVETVAHPDPMAMHAFYKYFTDKDGQNYINSIFAKHLERIKII